MNWAAYTEVERNMPRERQNHEAIEREERGTGRRGRRSPCSRNSKVNPRHPMALVGDEDNKGTSGGVKKSELREVDLKVRVHGRRTRMGKVILGVASLSCKGVRSDSLGVGGKKCNGKGITGEEGAVCKAFPAGVNED